MRLVRVFLVTIGADHRANFNVTPVLAHLWMVHAGVSFQDFLQERVVVDSAVGSNTAVLLTKDLPSVLVYLDVEGVLQDLAEVIPRAAAFARGIVPLELTAEPAART